MNQPKRQLLPVEHVLPQLRTALRDRPSAVLIAPPGAGKTTAVAPALLDEDWCTGQILLLSPRRVAARAAAERMAEMFGEKTGETVGYLTRLDSKVSAKTRIVILTEAIFVNRIVDDPELAGVSAVLFDEAHERHLDSDLGLALALETQQVLRQDLRLLVMSATIDGARFARLLGADAPVIESEGQSFPLRIEWFGSNAAVPVEDHVAEAVRTAWRDESGDILVFLPGVREIERVRERLEPRLSDALLLPLHGQVDPVGQRHAIRRDPKGRRRIVLATAIAETSLTLDGVTVVVDAGLSRHAEFDRAAGTTHLVTHRASQAAATQRAGRAARQAPGVAYRLWEEGGHLGRPEFAPPEMEIADLAPLLLKLAKWGSSDPNELQWLDAPPTASVSAARAMLHRLGALDGSGRITPWGDAIATMPMAPDHAAAILYGAQNDVAEGAAQLVILLQERGLGGRSVDLVQRSGRWRGDRTRRAEDARRLARRWANNAMKLVERVDEEEPEIGPAACLALARPDFVAKRRDASGENWLSVGGRGFTLDPTSSLSREEWIVIGDAQGRAKGARITAAAALDQNVIEHIFQDATEEVTTVKWNGAKRRVDAHVSYRLGAVTLLSLPDGKPDPKKVRELLLAKALESIETLLPKGFFERASYAGIENFSADALREAASLWLAPLIEGRRDFDLPPQRFADAALAMIDWEAQQSLDKRAPFHYISPAGTTHVIDYAGEDAPSVEVRAQALFGLDQHPMIGNTPLLLKLTSPAGRPMQSTRDLPGFWRGSWSEVVKEMKGRYPKHRWPERPWTEKPSLKTKNAFSKGKG